MGVGQRVKRVLLFYSTMPYPALLQIKNEDIRNREECVHAHRVHGTQPAAVSCLLRLRCVSGGRLALVAELADRGGALPTSINRLSAEGDDVAILYRRRSTAE